MPHAIVIENYGAPDVMRCVPVSLPPPGPGQVRIRQEAVGVNYHDIYVRSGLYQTLGLPGVPGIEACGVIEAVGPGVAWQPGKRVAYVTSSYGAYASHRLIDASLLLAVPEDLSAQQVASGLLRGLTTHMLIHEVARLEPGMRVLVLAASGGMGQWISRWASQQGVQVIGTARHALGVERAEQAGCSQVLSGAPESFAEQVMALTDGKGVDVVFDGVGAATFQASLDALACCGHWVNYGQASGKLPPLEMSWLAAKSLSVSRPIVFHYLQDPQQRDRMARRVFSKLVQDQARLAQPQIFSLSQAAEAHACLAELGAGQPILLQANE